MQDWEKNPQNYLTNPDGSYILKKDGTPKKKPGRPKNSELSDIKLALQAKKKLDKKNGTRSFEFNLRANLWNIYLSLRISNF